MGLNLLRQLHLLIVDDDIDFLESISEIAETGGYKTTKAQSGSQALQIFNEQDINLLLIDLKMPGMNGIDTYKEIRKIANNKLMQTMKDQGGLETLDAIRESGFKVPAIIITACADIYKEELEKLKSIYKVDIIRKPFAPEELLNKIEAYSAAS